MSTQNPDQDEAGGQQLATDYRQHGREQASSPALDARILAAARVHVDARHAARARAQRKRFWQIGAPSLAGLAMLALVLGINLNSGALSGDANVLLPASIGLTPAASSAPAMPQLQGPAMAPASSRDDDICRVQIEVATASAQMRAQEIERLKRYACAAALANLVAPSGAASQ